MSRNKKIIVLIQYKTENTILINFKDKGAISFANTNHEK